VFPLSIIKLQIQNNSSVFPNTALIEALCSGLGLLKSN